MICNTPMFDPRPDWSALEGAVPPEHLPQFMHMGRVGEIQLYKHRWTRQYLNIDGSGVLYGYVDGQYVPVLGDQARQLVLRVLGELPGVGSQTAQPFEQRNTHWRRDEHQTDKAG
jgi:hypothetical protein